MKHIDYLIIVAGTFVFGRIHLFSLSFDAMVDDNLPGESLSTAGQYGVASYLALPK